MSHADPIELVRWHVPLNGIPSERIRPDIIHAIACSWLDSPTNASTAHPSADHRAPAKAWGVAPLVVVDDVPCIEIGTAGSGAAQRLMDSVKEGDVIRVGKLHGFVLSGPIAVAAAPLAPPVEDVPSQWTVRFHSPTGFRKEKRWSPLPDPFTIFRSTRNRMSMVFPSHHIDMAPARVATLSVRHLVGRSQVVDLGPAKACGFLGDVQFECPDGDVARDFDRLLHFASFVGMGSNTEWSMGCIEIIQSK